MAGRRLLPFPFGDVKEEEDIPEQEVSSSMEAMAT